jgi:hypothetical protein
MTASLVDTAVVAAGAASGLEEAAGIGIHIAWEE